MELKNIREKTVLFLKKYRYVAAVLLIGIVLMLLPTGTSNKTQSIPVSEEKIHFQDPTQQLTEILRQIHGAGKVQVLLTVSAGEKVVYQTDSESDDNGDTQSVRLETVIVTDKDRAQQGLVTQLLAPEYRGAVVVCDGADDPAVKLAVMEAVKNATGLSFDRISVLKMK